MPELIQLRHVLIIYGSAHRIPFFLHVRRRGRAKADGIAESVKAGAGHDRVQIDHAERPAGRRIQQDVVERCIIVRHAQRQLSGSQGILDSRHLCLPGQCEFNFGLDLRGPVHGVARQCLKEHAVTVWSEDISRRQRN